MHINALKSRLSGKVAIPASKSHTIRSVAIAALADGQSIIRNPLYSHDTLSCVSTYRSLGATIDTTDPLQWIVQGICGEISFKNTTIDVGNSGTTLAIALGSASLADPNKEVIFTGDYQIQNRPVGSLCRALTQLGASCIAVKNNDCAPVQVKGQLSGGKVSIHCPTSQYLSSLLLACPLADGDTEIEVPLLYEPDYAKMTLDWLDKQGIRYSRQEMAHFSISGHQKYTSFNLPVAADFSSATFFLCAGALLADELTLTGLDFSDSQPDKAVVDYLQQMGAEITISTEGVRIHQSSLRGVDIDMNRTPDALPAMAVTAAFASGTTRLLNVPQARNKETDRIACMAKELTKLGADIEELPDGMVIRGGKRLHPASLHGYDDHRIVMACAIAGMCLEDGPLTVDTAEAAGVTFPDFVPLMNSIGAKITLSK
ncbi:MAG: 3-phosphoshikimate 1-carboxyvinyltransferase [Sedimentisphaerales bacterium]|nr:3-phosphoshikimate 1-carboxyvinyltransferase [Sedimentisphaerales bacterium]